MCWKQVVSLTLLLSAAVHAADQQGIGGAPKSATKYQQPIAKERQTPKTKNATEANVEFTQVEKIYLSKKYWEQMNWQQAEKSSLWLAPGWLPREGILAESVTSPKQRKVILFGKEFNAALNYEDKNVDYKLSSTIFGSKATKNDCIRIQKELTAIFGQPVFNDGSWMALYYSPKNFMRVVEMSYQWDIGDSRINAGCGGSETNETENQLDADKFLWSIYYAHQSVIKKLVPKFALRCTRKSRMNFGDREQRDLPDQVFWVDTYSERVTNASGQIISDTDSFQATDLEIKFKQTGENKMVFAYVLDRVGGSLSVTIHDKQWVAATINGKCEKSEAIEKKF
jgi:hypothetical protein